MADHVKVLFGGRQLLLEAGLPLNVALYDAGAPVESPCGGRGKCGRCCVRLDGSVPPPSEADALFLDDDQLARGFRLSCQHAVADDLAVEVLAGIVPVAGRVQNRAYDAERKQGLMAAGAGGPDPFPLEPLVRKVCVKVAKPVHEDYRGDWERLVLALREAGALASESRPAPVLEALRALPGVLRRGDFQATVLLDEGDRVLAVEHGDTSRRLFGVAFDIGTTTLGASLVDLTTGAELAFAAAANPQAAFGGDLMSRLGHAFAPEGRRELQSRVLEALNSLIQRLAQKAAADPAEIGAATIVGNTAMHHLFLGLEVEQLGLAPYVPAATGALTFPARQVGLAIQPAATVYMLPCVAGFAGSDLAACLLATRLWESDTPRLVIDLGTNGELLLGDRHGVLACSAPAGPAFEGGAISQGMRATAGAIQSVWPVTGPRGADLAVDVIDNAEPSGLCGSGLVDAVAALLDTSLLDPGGRMRTDPAGLPPGLGQRLTTAVGGAAVRLAGPVVLTQKDVRQLQLAKGAIRSGADVLLAERGIAPDDLAEICLAGTFGNYIREESALAIGLLPPVPAERVRPIGNAAAAGARLALISRVARESLEREVARVRHVPLATRPDYQDVFIEATSFPRRAGN